MILTKNDIVTATVTDFSADGAGVAKADGTVLFIPFTAPGDTVKAKVLKVKKNYCFCKALEFISLSGCRKSADCAAAGKCGGCAFRHINYQSELDFKQKRVAETLKRIGGVNVAGENILSANENRYRNKAQYPVTKDGIGFYAAHSHRTVFSPDCLLSPKSFSTAAAKFYEFLKQKNIPVYDSLNGKGLVRHLCLRQGAVSGEVGVTVVINGTEFAHAQELTALFKSVFGENLKSISLNINTQNNNVILGKENRVIFGRGYIYDTLCGVKVKLSPNSFYQVNHAAATLLYNKVKEYVGENAGTVLDLYCGTGTIGLSLAKSVENLIGVEIVPEAVADAKDNARENGIENARFILGDAAAAAKTLARENLKPDTVILDPPRKGCAPELLDTVAHGFKPEKIVYVSCDAATLARDTKILETLGYKLTAYTPVDMFPRTAHVETVAVLARIDSSI